MHEYPLGDGALTDLYEMTMMQAYERSGMTETAVFEMYFRDLGDHRNYFLTAGLDAVLSHLENLHFDEASLEYLADQNLFSDSFLNTLADLRFTGDVWAMPEAAVCYPEQPVVQVIAPLPQAQLVETVVLNQVHVHTLIASKASRIVTAADGRRCVDFGSRRAHGLDAAMALARSSYLAGFGATSNVAAGRDMAIPIAGTMAHSFIQACDDEQIAFERFLKAYPESILLIDTYDTLRGADRVIDLAKRMGDRFKVKAVRIDSGYLGELAQQVRGKFDAAGLSELGIVVSGGLDEYKIKKLIDGGAPIDGFGVGTNMAVSTDMPHMDCAYKLVEYAGEPRTKLSSGKRLLPGRKQVYRTEDADTICRFDESPGGEPMLIEVMRGGERTDAGRDTIQTIRQRAQKQIDALPADLRAIEKSESARPVHISDALRNLYNQMRRAQGQ